MPISPFLVAVAADPANTLVGRRIQLDLIPDGESIYRFRGVVANYTRNQQEPLKRRAVQPDNSLAVDRTVRIGGANDVLELQMDEPKDPDVLALFLNRADFHAAGRLWIVDPDDATAVASLMTEEFNCTGYFGGSVNFNNDGFVTIPVQIHVDGILEWNRNAAVGAS